MDIAAESVDCVRERGAVIWILTDVVDEVVMNVGVVDVYERGDESILGDGWC